MFTGIIQHVGRVRNLAASAAGKRLVIDVGPLSDGLAVGDSLAVNGACLTAAGMDGQFAAFDVIFQTLTRTDLGALAGGDSVNLERPLRLGDRLDGHIVQGHVDGLAAVERIDRAAGQWVVHFTCDKALSDDMAPKGSIAIDGVSLTLVDVAAGRFSVALIPTTIERTTLAALQPRQRVNIETDILGKYVRRLLEQGAKPAAGAGGLTLEKLRETGFI